MPTRRQLIQKITLNANASSVTFSNIPQNYTDLRIVASTRSSFASNAITVKLRFNGSASDTNHSCRRLVGNGSSATSDTQTFCQLGGMQGTTTASNTYSVMQAYIPNYSGANNKTIYSVSATEDNVTTAYIANFSNLFSSTSPITSIEVLDASGNFVANSTFYLYGITQVPIIRGGEVSVVGGFKYHIFKSSGSLQVIEGGDVECLVVAGGGAGASGTGVGTGGGGGAGGLIRSKIRLNNQIHTITIGAGGTVTAGNSTATSGNNTTLGSILTSTGGGRGGDSGLAAATGGSGGGGGTGAGASGTSGQGNSGGSGQSQSYASGGGGGAGAVGGNSTTLGSNSDVGGSGGAGIQWLNGLFYAGGGGGGTYGNATVASGGSGGGGAGSAWASPNNTPPIAGVANTGGGGGGARLGNAPVAPGGSGIVIIRYPYDGN